LAAPDALGFEGFNETAILNNLAEHIALKAAL
jgi:hypothetical protein